MEKDNTFPISWEKNLLFLSPIVNEYFAHALISTPQRSTEIKDW